MSVPGSRFIRLTSSRLRPSQQAFQATWSPWAWRFRLASFQKTSYRGRPFRPTPLQGLSSTWGRHLKARGRSQRASLKTEGGGSPHSIYWFLVFASRVVLGGLTLAVRNLVTTGLLARSLVSLRTRLLRNLRVGAAALVALLTLGRVGG